MGLTARRMKADAGQALVEVALSATILLTLLVGAVEFSRLAYTSIEVSNAAKAAVQYGAQNSTTAADSTGMKTAATNEAANITLGTTSISTSYACSDGSTPSGSPPSCSTAAVETILTVQTQATFSPVFNLPGLPTSYTIHGQAIQKVLQ